MSQIALKEYLSRVEALLDENLLAEASAHCHFILQQYPRHVHTYRTLGRALLEQQYYREAIDIFYRVLGADPEDLIARAGLAIALRENGDVEKAIWHMERAFEIDPYNAAIRDELSDLHQRHDREKRLGLTRPALARLYTSGRHYRLAINELQGLLDAAPHRHDLKILLAESYYWAGLRAEAISQCAELVRHLPDCIKANAILAETWLKTGQESNAEPYIRRLIALTVPTKDTFDSETLLGRALSSYKFDEIPDKVLVDSLDYVPAEAHEWELAQRWAEGESVDLDSEDGPPNWLGEMGDFSPETSSEDIEAISEEDLAQVWLEDLAELEDNFLQAETAVSDETGESGGVTSPESSRDMTQERSDIQIMEDHSVPDAMTDPAFADRSIEAGEFDHAATEDDLKDLDILGEDAIREALITSSRDDVDESITPTDSFRDELIRELESLSSSPEEEEWFLGDESIDVELFDSADTLLHDFEDDLSPKGEVPNWLEKEVGFSGWVEKPVDQDRSERGRDTELTGEMVPPFDEGQVGSERPQEIDADLDWSDEFGENVVDLEGRASKDEAIQDESDDELPEWLAGMELESEANEASSTKEDENVGNLNLEDIPWLDEFGAYSDDSQEKSGEDT